MAIEGCGDIFRLPEDCMAYILSLTSPKDACRLSAVAPIFNFASQSHTVWDRFLPSDYREIISRAVGGPDPWLGQFHSRKELYLHLCDHPILIDDGRKSFSLEKSSGKKCYMLAARELSIVWGDTPEYWQWISLPESRFSEVAELLNVCWLEIGGKINTNMLSSSTNYAAYLVFTWNAITYGFDLYSAEGYVSISGHESEKRSFFLISEEERRELYQIVETQLQDDGEQRQQHEDVEQYPMRRDDRWMEVELGEYFVERGEAGDFEVCLKMLTGNWKKGIIVQGIEIRPKDCE